MHVVPHEDLEVMDADGMALACIREPAPDEVGDGVAVDLRVAFGVG